MCHFICAGSINKPGFAHWPNAAHWPRSAQSRIRFSQCVYRHNYRPLCSDHCICTQGVRIQFSHDCLHKTCCQAMSSRWRPCQNFQRISTCVQDMELMFANCLLYNGAQSVVGRYGLDLEQLWLKQWAKSGLSGVFTTLCTMMAISVRPSNLRRCSVPWAPCFADRFPEKTLC
jgi:hypothetical protein